MNEQVKKKMRSEYCIKRTQIPIDKKRESESKITQAVLNNTFYLNAEEVLCYVSTDAEISTRDIISNALANGKRVFVPKCTEQKGVMKFYGINSFEDLKIGSFGILEPIDTGADNEWNQDGLNALCIVPALCCDRFGNRLGYGGGYYDRFLCEFVGKSICLCYSCFADAEFPIDEYDVPCDEIIKG